MNRFYSKFISCKSPRTPVFEWVCNKILDNEPEPTILEIGAIRPNLNDPDLSFYSDGYSTFYWASYLQKRGCGKLVIVDTDEQTIENAKVILEDFKDVKIEFICDNGFNWVGKPGFSLIYLDGPDDCQFTFQMFRSIDRYHSTILCDDANFTEKEFGKCLLLRRYYGGSILFRLPNTTHEMMLYPKIQSGNFTVNKINLQYCRSNINRAFENERSVETPLGDWFIQKFSSNVIELGAVMCYYGCDKHIIIDLADLHPKSQKIDGLLYDYTGKNVLSLSTVEHFNQSEYGNSKDEDAITVVKKITSEASNYLISFPIGYHPMLDTFIKNSSLPRVILKRKNWQNEWEIDPNNSNFDYQFGHFDGRFPDGQYNNANAVCLITNLPELHE